MFFSAGISSITCGIIFAWPSPSIPILISEKHEYKFTLEQCSYFTMVPSIASMITCFMYARFSNRFGRKYTLLSLAIPHTLALIITALADSIYVFYLGRILGGFADAGMFVTLPSYVGEITTPKVRGTWGNILIMFLTIGQLIVNCIGGYCDIKTTAWICLLFPLAFACTFSFMPESPYYCVMKGDIEKARESLLRLRNNKNVEAEIEKLKNDVSTQMKESTAWKDILFVTNHRRAFTAGLYLRVAQQFSGMACFAVYTQYIFRQATEDISAAESSIAYCGSMVMATFFAVIILDKLGRRRAMFISLTGCTLVLGCETVYFYISERIASIDVTPYSWIPLAGMLGYVLMYSLGLGIVPTLMLGELFSASIKEKALCMLLIFFCLKLSILTKLFQVLQVNFGLYSCFAFFTISCVVNTVLAFFFVPETKGKTLEEIQQGFRSIKR